VRIETFEQLINVGGDRQFAVSKAHQRKAFKRFASCLTTVLTSNYLE